MTRGLYAAVSGVRSNQTSLDVISNNVANMNTIAFKSGDVRFSALFAQTINAGSAPSSSLGGTNPSQVGSGSQVSDISTNFGQGGAQFTGQSTDLLINGNGYFVMRVPSSSGNSSVLSRAGNFSLDSGGNLVDASTGRRVQGSSQQVGSSSTTIASIYVPTEVQFAKDLNASGATVGTWIGNSSTTDWTTGTLALKTGATSRTVQVAKLVSFSIGNDGAITATYSNGDRLSVRVDPNTVVSGTPSSTRMEVIHLPAEGGTYGSDNDGNGTSNVSTDSGIVTQRSGSMAVFTAPSGGTAMQGMQMCLQTATVTNPKGLLYDGSNSYTIGANAGTVSYGHPGSENRGGVQSGALESSNVEMAGEFTKMILAQRAVEASSKMIRAQSDVLQTIINAI